MALPLTRRLILGLAIPALSVAALGLSACSPDQNPTDVKGTTPAPFTSSPPPSASEHGAEHGATTTAEAASKDSVTTELKNSSGKVVGTVTFKKDGDYVEIEAEVKDLDPGFHGFHVHEKGECVGDFTSAGGHYGMTEKGAKGDLTAIQVREDKEGELTTTTDAFTVEDIKGKAVIVHELSGNFGDINQRYSSNGVPGPDEETLKTGDAGARVACGVIK
jgi:superoxide dismutase, Cu-Zn family